MVIVFHFVGHHGEGPHWAQLAGLGQTGVDLFFVLSGFLITRILLLSKDSEHYFRPFYARRVLRIFPLYYGFLVIHFFLLPPLFGDPVPSFPTQIWSWLYLENLPATFSGLQSSGPGHFWTLAVEEHFYLVWPALVFFLSRRQFALLVFGTLVVPLLLRFVFLNRGIPVFYFTLTRMDALGWGALLALLLTSHGSVWIKRIGLFRWLPLLLALLLLPSFVLLSGSRLNWLQAVKLSLIPAFYFSLVGFCLTDPAAAPLNRLFSLAALRWLGAISYGLYVFHPLCIALIHELLAPASFLVDLILSAGSTILAAYLSFRFFEAPILKFKRWFPYEVRTPPSEDGAAEAERRHSCR